MHAGPGGRGADQHIDTRADRHAEAEQHSQRQCQPARERSWRGRDSRIDRIDD